MSLCLKFLYFPDYYFYTHLMTLYTTDVPKCVEMILESLCSMSTASYLDWLRYVFKRTNCWILCIHRSFTCIFIFTGPWNNFETSGSCLKNKVIGLGLWEQVQMRDWKWITLSLIPLLKKSFHVHILVVYYLHKRKTWLM